MMTIEEFSLIRSAKLFANTHMSSVEHLLEPCYLMTISGGEALLEPGMTNENLYLILEGELRVYLTYRSMTEHLVLGFGDCVGEMSMVDGQPVSARVVASLETKLLVIPRKVIWELVDDSHSVARNLLSILSGRMRNSNLVLVTAQNKSLEFEEASSVDVLTGLHNRRWMMAAFPRAITRCQRGEEPLCLIMTDTDSLSKINTRFGHPGGDAALSSVAWHLADSLRVQDLIARYGGDRFLLLLPQASIDTGLMVAERLRSKVMADCGLQTEEGFHGITISCGVAQMRTDETLEDLIARAEAALLRAKESGRNLVEAAE